MVNQTQHKYGQNRADGAKRYQTETVIRSMLIVSDGRNTNAKGDDKRNRHRACGPTLSPIGVIESSTPRVKNIIPATKSTAPSKNAISMLGDIGAISPLLCRREIRNSSAFQLHCYGIRLFRILPHFLFSISLYSRSIITLL